MLYLHWIFLILWDTHMQGPVKVEALFPPESIPELNVPWSVPTHRKHP